MSLVGCKFNFTNNYQYSVMHTAWEEMDKMHVTFRTTYTCIILNSQIQVYRTEY